MFYRLIRLANKDSALQDVPGSTIVTSDDLWVDPIRESQTLITPEALH